MKNYILHDEWKIIEEGFVAEYNRISESIFSIGNGYMGQRANFEEHYSGDSLQGSYIAGIYYPDKTRVGWWKNGYPEYFAKVLNAPNWIGINVGVDGEQLDLSLVTCENFKRELNMRDGYLQRSFTAIMHSGKQVEIVSKRFVSVNEPEAGLIRYSIKPLNFSGKITLEPYVDANVTNEDSNYDEQFWTPIDHEATPLCSYVISETKKTNFQVCAGMQCQLWLDGVQHKIPVEIAETDMRVSNKFELTLSQGQELMLDKFASVTTSLNHSKENLAEATKDNLARYSQAGFVQILDEHSSSWRAKWEEMDIRIEGDISAQQAIRFNIFQLYQTYTGEDARLNIGPKGFTGEKYGGVTYWDTEAYCLPFYLRTADQHVARNLLKYRHNHLPKAIENAEKLGFKNGAALYPMVTINGEECHNEWEITFEEIHRNGAIAFAIYNYVRYTNDVSYLAEYGLEVLIAISRFWAQRVNWSEAKQQYVMLGVTGPNEYENNVNNNWYTSTVAIWTMSYTLEVINAMMDGNPEALNSIYETCNFRAEEETKQWAHIVEHMHLGEDEQKGIFLQQEGFLDKDLTPAAELPKAERPIHEHWSWDRILRSCYIKQADVLQGIYMFEELFDEETIARNFDFYEPLTVHESSLSACIHSILAAKLGRIEKAYEMYLHTARLDLDDYNNDTDDGLHITSMGGTWMAIVEGFAGLRINKNTLSISPVKPSNWQAYEFRIVFRNVNLNIRISEEHVTIENLSDTPVSMRIYNEIVELLPKSIVSKELKSLNPA
jgi:maltose phosphorylase